MTNENSTAIELTNLQYGTVKLLARAFEFYVFCSVDDFQDFSSFSLNFESKLTKAKNNVLVQFSYVYGDNHYVLLSLIDNNGLYYSPDGSPS